jgi:hypothetical protein
MPVCLKRQRELGWCQVNTALYCALVKWGCWGGGHYGHRDPAAAKGMMKRPYSSNIMMVEA